MTRRCRGGGVGRADWLRDSIGGSEGFTAEDAEFAGISFSLLLPLRSLRFFGRHCVPAVFHQVAEESQDCSDARAANCARNTRQAGSMSEASGWKPELQKRERFAFATGDLI